MRQEAGRSVPGPAGLPARLRGYGSDLAKRLAAAVITAVLSSLIVFLLIRSVPGDVVGQMLGQTSDPAAAQALREFFGLDQPLWSQYLAWLAACAGRRFRHELGARAAGLGHGRQRAAGHARARPPDARCRDPHRGPAGFLAGIYEGRRRTISSRASTSRPCRAGVLGRPDAAGGRLVV